MKILITSIFTFLTGLAIGVVAMPHVSGTKSNPALAIIALQDTGGKAMYATLLYDKRYDDLQYMLEQDLHSSLNFISSVNMCKESIEPATSYVRGYYDATGRPIPSQTIELLKSIPPVKGVPIRRLIDASISLQNNANKTVH